MATQDTLQNTTMYYSNITSTVSAFGPKPILSDELRDLIVSIINFFLFVFATLGVITNIINIRVFMQQGVSSDSNTIGLFALAIADFLGCLTLVPTVSCEVFRLMGDRGRALSISCDSLTVLLCFIPHALMSRITCWITVYIAIERSLCVLMPFKVKSLLRPKLTATSMTLIFFIFICFYVPLLPFLRIKWVYVNSLNATIALNDNTELGNEIMKHQGFVFNTVLSTLALIIIVITTGLMLFKLNRYTKWRNVASAGNTQSAENVDSRSKKQDAAPRKRDVEVLKTVVTVTGLFLVCLSMSHFPGIATTFIPGFSFDGYNKNAFTIFYIPKYLFDLVNSSLNFFFYIRISTRYKTAFNQVFKKE